MTIVDALQQSFRAAGESIAADVRGFNKAIYANATSWKAVSTGSSGGVT
ncbi:hypothetical protein ABTX15_32680 [Micromonospora sp. NPDC094482]